MTAWRLSVSVFLALSFTYRMTRLHFAIRKARSEKPGTTSARAIFWIMTGTYFAFLGFGAGEALGRPFPQSWLLSGLGLGMYLFALWMRERVMKDLGRFFSPDIEIRKGHRVVREGYYGFVRHPLLVCLIIEILGLGLALNAPRALLWLGAGIYGPVILIRKYLEEKALVRQLGQEYQQYQKEVGAFIPKLNAFLRTQEGPSHA